MAVKIAEETLALLSACQTEGRALRITGALSRKEYEALNKVLEAAGGKWNRGQKAHLFEGDAAEAIDPIILTGEYTRVKQDLGQFDTPDDLAQVVVHRAGIKAGMDVLEPSVGIGRIAAAAERAGGKVFGIEIDAKRLDAARAACKLSLGTLPADFLSIPVARLFPAIVMNPPFASRADIHHVRRALDWLEPGGMLVAIMSAGVMFREDAIAKEFRAFGFWIERLPDGAFKSSGTSVGTCLVTYQAPEVRLQAAE